SVHDNRRDAAQRSHPGPRRIRPPLSVMLVDLHVHTKLSADSNVSAEQYLEANQAAGGALGGICFTEHRLFPTDREIDSLYAELSDRYGVAIFKGIEADTNLGHLLLFGVSPAIARNFDLTDRMLRANELIPAMYHEG